MAFPTFVAASNLVEGTGAISVAWPSHQAGDIGLLFVEHADSTPVATPSGGWATFTGSSQGIGTDNSITRTHLQVFWLRATSGAMGDASVADSGDHTMGTILTFRGCVSSGNPIDASTGDASSDANATAVTFPAITTTQAATLVVLALANQTDTATDGQIGTVSNGNLASISERFDQNEDSGNGGGIAVITGTKATAGSTGTSTATISTSSRQARVVLALAPEPLNSSGALTFTHEVAGTLSTPLDASGDLSFATTIDVDADFLIEAGGGTLTFATQVDGALSVPVNLSGALAFGWELGGENALDVEGTVMSGAIEFASQVSGSLSVPDDASGALEFATSIDVDADFIIEADGALEFGWSIAGSLAHVSSVSGALAFGWGLSGRLRTQFPGSCVLLDAAVGTVELEHADASFATLLDAPSGTATLEAS